jgi:kexin
LKNTGQKGANNVAGIANEDINVSGAWAVTKGQGVRIAIVDDGMEMAHEDLASNVGANGLSHNYVSTALSPTDPTNDSADTTSGHGTACAGIAAARDSNGLGGVGVAPRATLVGYNATLNLTHSNESDAMTRNAASVGVSSNSWGAADGTGELTASSSTWKSAINTGLSTGRGGKGTVYTWAAGNGAAGSSACSNCYDNSNYDGRANYRGVMAVAAVNDQGVQSSYSESGANLWVAAPGGEFCSTHTITTTDRTGPLGHNTAATAGVSDYNNQNYTKCMNGTSSATPTVAGVVALMLAANPNLGWRDVRTILAITSRGNDWGTLNPDNKSRSTGWLLNGGGYWFHHKYGFGVVNADLAVKLAIGAININGNPVTGTQVPWANLPTEVVSPQYSSSFTTPKAIPDNDMVTGVSDTIVVTSSGVASIEWMEITFTATHPIIGDLDVTLTNVATGMVSHLAVPHSCAGTNYACTSTYSGWVFGSAAHLNEAANGSWKLTVKDGYTGVAANTGTFDSWKLKFYGH